MSEQAPESQGTVEGVNNESPATGPEGDQGTGINPAWRDVLSELPESLHSLITPKLKEWDANVTRKFQENAEKYKPWEDIVSQSNPELVFQGLQLMQAIENDPKGVWELIGQHYNLTPAQAQKVVEQATGGTGGTETPNVPTAPPNFTPDSDDPSGQYILYLQDMLNKQALAQQQIVEYLSKQDQASQRITQQQQLENYLQQLHEANKDITFDDDYITTKMANGVKGEDAVKQYRAMIENAVKSINAPNNDAPVVSGASGGVPSARQDVTKLSPKETSDLVAEMLKRNAEQRNS